MRHPPKPALSWPTGAGNVKVAGRGSGREWIRWCGGECLFVGGSGEIWDLVNWHRIPIPQFQIDPARADRAMEVRQGFFGKKGLR